MRFKISLDEFVLKQGETPVSCELNWNVDKTVAALNPAEILAPEKEFTLFITLSFKEKRSGYWATAQAGGEALTEKHSFKFVTGKAPDYIPVHNVAFSYPVINQLNYYRSEFSMGYVTLKQGQSYLFNSDGQWSQILRLSTKDGRSVERPIEYNIGAKEVRFSMPTDLLIDQTYEFAIINVPKNVSLVIDRNVSAKEKILSASNDNELSVRTKSASGTISEGQEKLIYGSHFRTSMFNTFQEKIAGVRPSSGWRNPIVAGVHVIGSNIGGPEPFSLEEIQGTGQSLPLVQMEADLTNIEWYNDRIFPLLYKDYPLNGFIRISSSNRNTDILGIVPTKGVFLYQVPWQLKLTTNNLEVSSSSYVPWVGRFDYYLAWFMFNDFRDMADQAANYVYRYGTTERLTSLMTSAFPVIRGGDYWVNISYKLPGRNTITSIYRHKIHNPVD